MRHLGVVRRRHDLPDWAVIELSPGRIVDTDFFDEQWVVKARREQPYSRTREIFRA